MVIGPDIKVQAHASGSPYCNGCVNCFKHQTRTVLDRSAVRIGTTITPILKKLIKQVTIRTVELNSVETSGKGVFRSFSIVSDNGGNFEFQRAGSYERLLWSK